MLDLHAFNQERSYERDGDVTGIIRLDIHNKRDIASKVYFLRVTQCTASVATLTSFTAALIPSSGVKR